MFSPKSNLYRSEWLELVFDDRNKSYGAYDLRKHYDNTLLKALGFTVLPVICLFLLCSFIMTRKAIIAPEKGVVVILTARTPVTKPPVTPPKPRIEPPVHHASVAFPPPVVAPDNLARKIPDLEELKHSTIGQTNAKGDDGGNIDIPASNPGTGVTEDNNAIHTIATIEVMPQFPGGEAAWAKFLQKNLRYPGPALDAGIGGKVYISFVVEKDGHLSDITVVRGVGYGLEEEAIRVLKLVPPWKPGIQNGQPVRVRYNMPFNFQLPADNN